MPDNGQMIIDLDKKRMNAMEAKDIATLNALLSDTLVYTHSSARVDTKQSACKVENTILLFHDRSIKNAIKTV